MNIPPEYSLSLFFRLFSDFQLFSSGLSVIQVYYKYSATAAVSTVLLTWVKLRIIVSKPKTMIDQTMKGAFGTSTFRWISGDAQWSHYP